MSKNNTEPRATLLQRVNALEARVESLSGHVIALDNLVTAQTAYRNEDTVRIDKLRSTLRSVEAQLADLSSCLAAHQMDTLRARIKRLLHSIFRR